MALNGIGDLIKHCLDCYPATPEMYQQTKAEVKRMVAGPMARLVDKLTWKSVLRAFLAKTYFNSGEVDYLTMWWEGRFHVFHAKEVVQAMGKRLAPKLAQGGQKVVLRDKKAGQEKNVLELEVRHDNRHYVSALLNSIMAPTMSILTDEIVTKQEFSIDVWVYGQATRNFGR